MRGFLIAVRQALRQCQRRLLPGTLWELGQFDVVRGYRQGIRAGKCEQRNTIEDARPTA